MGREAGSGEEFAFSERISLVWLPHLAPEFQATSILRQNSHLDWLKGLELLAYCCTAEHVPPV